MIRAQVRVVLAVGVVVVAAAALAVAWMRGGSEPLPPRAPEARPVLLLLTSLPIVFGEDFSVQQYGSPALDALEARYRVVPIGAADPAELARGRLLLMAQPRAQPAEDLVALDTWVRSGGRVLLLADPMLDWPSERPLGDPLRPLATFMDTGLLAHWGLRLDAPDVRGPREGTLGDYDVVTVSPGTLSGACDIGRGGLVARCRIGEGRVTVVADADILDSAELGRDARHNFDCVLAVIAKLERK
jgi:hypothetical protein